MDDRFDRRELLLHLGDMLEALSCASRAGPPDAPVAQLAKKEASLQDLKFLQALAPQMTVADFAERVASAFFLWPRELLETALNRHVLASTVRHDLFEGNPAGWAAYMAYVQKKVAWFGKELPAMKQDTSVEPVHNPADEASPVEASTEPTPRPSNGSRPKTGWPWARSESAS
jgi:hypothetical protein